MIKRIVYIIIISLGISEEFDNFGTFIYNANSSVSMSMSDATSAWLTGVNAVSSNPAGLATLAIGTKNNINFSNSISFELGSSLETENVSSYSDTKFPYIAGGWGMKVPNTSKLYLGFGGSYQSILVDDVEEWNSNENYLGKFNYSESALSAAIAIQYEPVRVGFKWTNYMQDAGSGRTLSNFEHMKETFFIPTEFGIQYMINNQTNIGLHIAKSSRVGLYDYTLARTKLGVSSIFKNSYNELVHRIAFDLEKLTSDNGNIKIGYQGKFIRDDENKYKLKFRFGLRSEIAQENNNWDLMNSLQLSGGLSFKIFDTSSTQSLILDIAVKQHIYPSVMEPLSRMMYFSISYKKF